MPQPDFAAIYAARRSWLRPAVISHGSVRVPYPVPQRLTDLTRPDAPLVTRESNVVRSIVFVARHSVEDGRTYTRIVGTLDGAEVVVEEGPRNGF